MKNGGEFLNALVIKWTIENDYLFTRSRAGKKNDNAHVERANRVYVRELIGYSRFTSLKAFELINKIYLIDGMYVNFFIPGRKITEKIYNRATGKSRKIFDEPRTAYNRVLEHYSQTDQGEEICKPLQEVYNSFYNDTFFDIIDKEMINKNTSLFLPASVTFYFELSRWVVKFIK